MKIHFKKYLYLYFSIIFLLFCVIYTYHYWWDFKYTLLWLHNAISFFSCALFSLCMAIFISKNFLSSSDNSISFLTKNEKKIKDFGEAKFINLKRKASLIWLGIHSFVFIIIISLFQNYTKQQLKKYGNSIDVKIEKISGKIYKSYHIVTLKYENIEKEFAVINPKIGEIKTIIYSKNNPKISEIEE